jgi:predicted Zn-dependent peptidase
MTLVVSGGVKALRVKTVAKKTFGTLKAAETVFPANDPEPYQIASHENIIDRDTRLTYIVLGWHICKASDKDIYALDALRALLGLGRGSLLSKNIKDRRRLVADLSAELFATREPGMFAITAKLRTEDVNRAIEEILKELNDIKQKPLEDLMLRDAVKAMESAHTLDTKDAEGQAFALGYWATVYGWGDQVNYMDIIAELTPADLQRVAQKYIGEGNYTLVVVGPVDE